MIQEQTILNVSDNSGAKKVLCIKVLGGSKKKYAKIGDIIKVSIKECLPNSKVKKGDVLKALIIRTKKSIIRKNQFIIKFDVNSCILINNNEQMIGTRIFGPITKEIKNINKFSKIVSLATEII